MSAPRVAVIGGGWAGCAAAVALADAGCAVHLFEAAPQLGGRARRVIRHGLALDNGQHLLLGAYRETLALLAQLHAQPPFSRRPLAIATLGAHVRGALALNAWPLPAPFNLLLAIACARGLSLSERAAAVRWFARLKRAGYRCAPRQTVAELTSSLPDAVALGLLHPLCLAALNTPPAQASAQVFANVLRAAFGEGADGADVLHVPTDVGALVPDASSQWLQQRGHRVQLQCAACIADVDPSRVTIDAHAGATDFDAALVAVAPHQLAQAFAPPLVPRERALEAAIGLVDALSWEPITTVYLGYATAAELPAALVRLDDRPGQWLFARPDIVASAPAPAPRLAMVVAVVVSANGPHGLLAHAVLAANIDAQLRAARADWPPRAWSQVIEEKRATYACTPVARRPVAGMLLPRVALAGDYTDDQFPATLEAAVRSGNRAAAALMATLG
ncbi:MAG: hydroxysqualene dehydroxylase HpnE [Casimicrobiaceae bacterium]